jgi:hypothetical protein
MDNPTQHPMPECVEPAIPMCVKDRCSCVVPYSTVPQQVTGAAAIARHATRCEVTIGYAQHQPEAPSLRFSGGDCAMNAEVALAVALAYFLRGSNARTVIP